MIEQFASTLAIVVLIAGAAEAIVEWIIAPLFDKLKERVPAQYQDWVALGLRYTGAAVSGVLVYLTGQNLFGQAYPNSPEVGRILTAILAGRGSNWIHEFFSAKVKASQLAALEARLLVGAAKASDWRDVDL